MKAIARWICWALLLGIALQLFFVARIAMMASVDPASTAFERSEAWRQLRQDGQLHWRQQWRPLTQISQNLQRAVIASEDDDFVNHDGVLWDAIEKARARNAKAMERAEQRQEKAVARAQAQAERRGEAFDPSSVQRQRGRIVSGGSTITQQLAKNLFLSSEKNYLRKGQELLITWMLEFWLDKQRIFEIYLNSVEWGEGIFGAEAAAQRYFGKSAAQLNAYEAARLAVMLPNPKGADKNPNSAYLNRRTATIAARMRYAELP